MGDELTRAVPEFRPVGRRCAVCAHPLRAQIDWELATDARRLVEISGMYELSYEAVRRHRINHLTKSLLDAAQRDAEERGEVYRDVVARLRDRYELLDERIRQNARNGASELVPFLREERERLLLEARITGVLVNRTDVNVSSNDAVMRDALTTILQRHPDLLQTEEGDYVNG